MGMFHSCLGVDYDSFDNGILSLTKGSICLKDEDLRTAIHALSFKRQNSDTSIPKSVDFPKITNEALLSLKQAKRDEHQLQGSFSIRMAASDDFVANSPQTTSSAKPTLNLPNIPQHEAALKLQKVYKSFRTRRQLADCAVLVEQRWWKLLDYALLQQSSISFFDEDKPDSVISMWSRARKKAAKVGHGLLKDGKARKLALQHWLEAIDPRHRYGHNLHLYFDSWLRCESKQPFFYWLDVGEGKEISLERCPRMKLQQQCIKYLGPKERESYEVMVENGRLVFRRNGELVDTTKGKTDTKWIFVLSTSKNLYVGKKTKGKFQHSSFLAGGAASSAGRLVAEDGVLKAIWPHSGHYRPTPENFQEFIDFLKENNVDLTNVKYSPTEDGEPWNNSPRKSSCRNYSFRAVSSKELKASEPENGDGENTESSELQKSSSQTHLSSEFQISDNDDYDENTNANPNTDRENSGISGSKRSEFMFQKPNLFENEHDENGITNEVIFERINSKKGTETLQLAKRLSRRWSTGAGARISCVRDYPSQLQFRVLEVVKLSPRNVERAQSLDSNCK